MQSILCVKLIVAICILHIAMNAKLISMVFSKFQDLINYHIFCTKILIYQWSDELWINYVDTDLPN